MPRVWPKSGLTVINEFTGVPFPVGGYDVASITRSIQKSLDYGDLLITDPQYIPPTFTADPALSATLGFTSSTLRTLRGPGNGYIANVYGRSAYGDGASGGFFWDSSSSAPEDGALVLGNSQYGRWKRIRPHESYVNVRWFGATGDGVTDDTAAIQAAINALGPFAFGLEVLFPAGYYKITSRLKVGAIWPAGSPGGTYGVTPWGNIKLMGVGGTGQGFPAVTLMWYGPATESNAGTPYPSSMLQLSGGDISVQKICFRTGVMCKVGAYINAGYFPGETLQGTTGIHIEECVFTSGTTIATPDASNGVALNGVVIDYYNIAIGNGENMQIRKCTFARMQDAAVWLRGGQPFNIQVKDCYINNRDLSTLGGESPFGTGFLVSTPYAQLDIDNTSCHRLSAIVALAGSPTSVTIRNTESEWCKKLFYFPSSGYGSSTVVQIIGGRYATEACATALVGQSSSSSPIDVSFLAADGRYIYSHGDCAISVIGAHFTSGYSYDPHFAITVTSDELSVIGCVLPTDHVMAPRIAAWDPANAGRTYSKGNRGRKPDGTFIPLPTLNGPSNPDGTVTITGSATTATVTFDTPEPTTTPFGVVNVPPHYRVVLSIMSKTAGAVLSQPYVTTDLTTVGAGNAGFQVALPTAPGGVESVTIAYVLFSV